jgi:DNA-binding response OmpR family regulator
MAPEGAKQILVVEDDSITCKVLRIALEHRGETVEFVKSYAAAEEAMEHGRPRMVILDLDLAEGNGRETLHWIRNNRTAPVVVFTPKPFAPRELVARVERALAA